ncbi:PadR family transcriptional regulator [Candidatus Woesearchaeota archaeon]|nr:PadR family transcriptional regulator [Candidatus Woesearchaeota archaeon]
MRGYLKILTLKALKEGEKTGYSLMKYVEEKTDSKPSFGSIYPLLEQLLKEKLVSCKEKDNKKFYSLTDKGKQELKDLLKKKDEVLIKIEEGMKLFIAVSGETKYNDQLKAIEMMRKGDINFQKMMEQAEEIGSNEMQKVMMQLILENKIDKNKKKIKEIMTKATEELKKLK